MFTEMSDLFKHDVLVYLIDTLAPHMYYIALSTFACTLILKADY